MSSHARPLPPTSAGQACQRRQPDRTADRRLFLERVPEAVGSAAEGRRSVVLLVDLDGPEAVDDAHGHAAGDDLLTAVGAALAASVREADTVARLGATRSACSPT